MKRSDRLKRVAEHFSGDQDEASRKLAELRSIMDQAEQRLEDLRAYSDSYHAGHGQFSGSATRLATLRNYTAFLSQLQSAVNQQEQIVAQARAAFEQQKQVWFEARTRVRALEQAAERRAVAEDKVLERAEQRELDELSLQRFIGGEH